ncbi:MAG: bactofilin family protein, partial [Silanimonas sp.]
MLGFGDSKTRAPRAGGSVDTLIGPQVVLRGDVQFAGGLYLEGQLVGRALAEVGTEATITVAARGRVEGELHAPVIVINGFVKGDVHAFERLELGPEAR